MKILREDIKVFIDDVQMEGTFVYTENGTYVPVKLLEKLGCSVSGKEGVITIKTKSLPTPKTEPIFVDKKLKGKKICLDAGHGGSNNNMGCDGKYEEKTMSLNVVKLLKPMLEEQGAEVKLTRDFDRYMSLAERVRVANEWGADLFISIHSDAHKGTSRGTTILSSIKRPQDDKMAVILLEEVSKSIGATPRKVWRRPSEKNPANDYYFLIQYTKMPAYIVEGYYHDNPEDLKLYYNDGEPKYAKGVFNSILRFFS